VMKLPFRPCRPINNLAKLANKAGGLHGLGQRNQIRMTLANLLRDGTTPVLLATGYSDAANRATEEGFTLVTKPYQPDAPLTAIREVMTVGRSSGSSNVIPLIQTPA
jgi:hypothetical protein